MIENLGPRGSRPVGTGLVASCSYLLALLYCFPWLRIPDVLGVAMPMQRLVAWMGTALLAVILVTRGRIATGPFARSFLRLVVAFLALLALNLLIQLASDRHFNLQYFIMDVAKYLAIFGAAFLIYYAGRNGLIDADGFCRRVMASGKLGILAVFLLLGLYWAGFRTDVTFFAPEFGGALGVVPTGAALPRIAGPTAEPQQLSIIFITPLMLLLAPENIRRQWPVAVLGAIVITLSQSKFSLVSLLLVYLYLLLAYPGRRRVLAGLAIVAAPLMVLVLKDLPTFAATLSEGLEAEAFVERLENLVLLLEIVRTSPIVGIGPGQYGAFRGEALFGDPAFYPAYVPNMDFLKVFAETGITGFIIILSMGVGFLVVAARAYRHVPVERRGQYLAFALGAVGILLNMLIGYELLHIFFWVNAGFVLFMSEAFRHRTSVPAGAVSPGLTVHPRASSGIEPDLA